MVTSREISPYLLALPASCLLLIYALTNGVPFVYPDTFTYFAYGETALQKVAGVVANVWSLSASSADIPVGTSVPADASPLASIRSPQQENWTPRSGRSVYYGVLAAFPGPFAAPWNGIILQAYCSALAAALAWRLALGSVGMGYLAAMAGLGVASTFGIFASTAMPDVWAAIGILSIAILVAAQGRMGRIDSAVLWGLVLYAALTHSSHLLVFVAFVGLFAVMRLTAIMAISWKMIGTLAAVLVLSVGLDAGQRMVMERAAGNPPLGMPFLTAHLVDGGPGMTFIRDACPDAGFAVCEGADELPAEWRDFIFKFSSPQSYKRRLVDEDASFALATLRHDPLAVIGLVLRDGARQVMMIGLETTPIRAAIGESAAVATSPGALAQRVREGRLYEAEWLYHSVSIINTALVLAGLVALTFVATQRHFMTGNSELQRLMVVVMMGIILNAAICGMLVSPYDRFQARVAWLIPVLSIIVLAAFLKERHPHFSEIKVKHS